MTRPSRRRVFVAVLLALTLPATAARAQQPAHIQMWAAGGLLGQYDGMPEYPGGSFDKDVGDGIHPYGGLQGLKVWLADRRKPGDLLLLAGNNLPPRPDRTAQFLDDMAALQPSVTALGIEDFLRALKNGNAGELVQRLTRADLHFVVSNAAVRQHRPGLNTITSNGFALQVDQSASVGWVRELNVVYPCSRLGLRATITQTEGKRPPLAAAAEARVSTQASVTGDRCRARVSLPAILRPASKYRLDMHSGDITATFTFQTDETLTPDPALVPTRPELPIVITLVDPHVRDMLADARWCWPDCDADDYREIRFLSAIEAFDAVLSLVEPSPTGRPVALMSQLDDTDTFTVLQHNTRVRFVVLPPDSAALGRAAERTALAGGGRQGGGGRGQSPPAGGRGGPAGGQYSGDLGYGAVLNVNTPAATQIWSRPEWFGETAHRLAADVDLDNWELTKAEDEQKSVKGWALCAKSAGPGVDYFVADWDPAAGGTARYKIDPAAKIVAHADRRYAEMAPDVGYDAAGVIAQGGLWTDLDSFAAAALDAMREGLNTDVALLPDDAIDENQLVYLREGQNAPTQALSYVFLDRVLFRAGAVEKVRLSATALIDTVNKILSAGRSAGVQYCLGGLDAPGCGASRLNAREVLVNGRRLDKNRFYTVAMPESVVLEAGLSPYGEDSKDLTDLMDSRFATRTTGAVETCAADYQSQSKFASAGESDGLPLRLERARARGNSPYFYIKPAEFSFSRTEVGEPAGGQGLFGKLGLQNGGAKPSQRISVNLGVDLGLVDTERLAVRVLGTASYGRARLNGQSSTDPNTSLLATRVDWKVPRGRFFGGLFWESQFADTPAQVTATSKGASATLTLVTARRDYRYVAGGFELEKPQFKTWFSIDPLRVSVATGQSRHEHVDVQIDGVSQSLAALTQLGAPGLLAQYMGAHPGVVPATYTFIDDALRRDRVQVDATPQFAFPFGGKTLNISLAISARQFVGPNAVPLAERQSATMKLTVAVPLYGLATLNLTGSEYVARVNGIGGWFTLWQPAVSLSIPVIASRHAGWVY